MERNGRQIEAAGLSLAAGLARLGSGELKTAAALFRAVAAYLDGAADAGRLEPSARLVAVGRGDVR